MVRRFHQRVQDAVVIVSERYEPKRLGHDILTTANRPEHFRHSVHVPGLRLKRDFDEIALGEGFRKVQQPPSGGNHT